MVIMHSSVDQVFKSRYLLMAFTKMRSLPGVATVSVALLVSLSACGSDSTGPSKLDSSAALQSLALGMGSVLAVQSPTGAPVDASFGGIAPLLDQIDVTIDGTTQTMFALGLRETFPDGTCMEDLFEFPSIPPDNAICTPPTLGLGVLLWQSHSPSAPPDRLIFIVGDVGTSNFDFFTSFTPAVAIYIQGADDFWLSQSGSLTSQVAATTQSCGLPLPPYAKAGSCNVATFDEEGMITFEEYSDTGPTAKRLSVTIPRQTIHGLWQAITETQRVAPPPG
jgi:hypothetical protein